MSFSGDEAIEVIVDAITQGFPSFGMFPWLQMRIHDSPTAVQRGEKHYNMQGDVYSEHTWETRKLLEVPDLLTLARIMYMRKE